MKYSSVWRTRCDDKEIGTYTQIDGNASMTATVLMKEITWNEGNNRSGALLL